MKLAPVHVVFRIHRHALSRAGGVGERVRIEVPSAADHQRPGHTVGALTGLRNTVAEEPISLCGIARVDKPH